MVSADTPTQEGPVGNGSAGLAERPGAATLSYLEYFELCERIHYASVIDGITPLNPSVIQARCTRVDPHYLRPVSYERVYVVDLDATYVTLPQVVMQEVLETYAATLKSLSPAGASGFKPSSKFCFVSCAKQFLLYTNPDFVLYLVPGVERLTSIQVNDLTYLLGEVARQGQEIPFTYELSFSLLLRQWFEQLFPDGQLAGLPDDVERSIIEQFWWRTPAPVQGPATSAAKGARAIPALPSISTSVISRTLPHIPRVKAKELVQETSSAYKDVLPYLLVIAWEARQFNLSLDVSQLLGKVASWKRVQHLEAGEPVEWSTLALAQIFKGLNDRDWKFSEGMQLRSNVTPIGAKPKMQFQSSQLRGSRTLEAARYGSHALDPVAMLGLNPAVLGHLNEPSFLAERPWLDFITRFYLQELQTELYLLHYAPQLAVFEARVALSTLAKPKVSPLSTAPRSSLSNLSPRPGASDGGTGRPELRRDKVVLYHVPAEAKFQHVALAEDVLPASILVDILKTEGADYRFFLVYPDLGYLEEMPVSVLIKELKGSHPAYYKEPNAISRLVRLQLPASLHAYPFQLNCAGILTPSDQEAEAPREVSNVREHSSISTRKDFQLQDDMLDALAESAYDSDFFGYDVPNIEALWLYHADHEEFSKEDYSPPEMDAMFDFYEFWENRLFIAKISIIEDKLKDQMPEFLLKPEEELTEEDLIYQADEVEGEAEKAEEGPEEGQEAQADGTGDGNEGKTNEDEAVSGDNEDEANEGEGSEGEPGGGDEEAAGKSAEETEPEELETYTFKRPPSDFMLVEVKRYDPTSRRFLNRERLCLVNLDTIKPNLDFPQYFLELAIHEVKNLKNEPSERYFNNTNVNLVFVSCNQRKIVKTNLEFLLHFNAIMDSVARDSGTKFSMPPTQVPINELDKAFLKTYKYYLQYSVFLSVNTSLAPADLRTLFDLPIPLLASFTSLSSCILGFQYFSIFWEDLWIDTFRGLTGGDAGSQGLLLLKRALARSKALFAPVDLKELDHPLITLFSQFNDENEEMQLPLQLVNISDQTFEFGCLTTESGVEKVFVIDALDYQQYNVFAYGRAFQEFLFDGDDHDDVLFFLVDLGTRTIMQVDIDFFRRHLIGNVADESAVEEFEANLMGLQDQVESATILGPFRLHLVLRYVIRHIEYLFDGLGRESFYPDFTEGILDLWRFDSDTTKFEAVEWKPQEAPGTPPDDGNVQE
jgi:hypothetical protein